MIAAMQRLYCYVDETGQDVTAAFFIVVAVVSDEQQDLLRKELVEIETIARTGHRKWHKSRPRRRLKYLQLVLQRQVAAGEVYFGRYQKPLPYFLPMLETLERAISAQAQDEYRAIVYVDGIDKKKAQELTNALRLRKIRLERVRSRRDEGEPLIRLADMWAGCLRDALLGEREAQGLADKATQSGYLIEVTK
jgi:hypothetical protein